MKNKKLRLVDIANLAKQGRYGEIPSGYKITWFGGEPGEAFRFEATDEDITISRNDVPKPTKLTIVGEYVPSLPLFGELLDVVDFGEVILRTNLELKTINAVYDLEKVDSRKLMEWIRKNSESITGRCSSKEEVKFDMHVDFPKSQSKIDIFNVLVTDFEFPGIFEEEAKEAHATFICDYFELA